MNAPRHRPAQRRPRRRTRFTLLGVVVSGYVVTWSIVMVILAFRDRIPPELWMTLPMGIGAIVAIWRQPTDRTDHDRDSTEEDR